MKKRIKKIKQTWFTYKRINFYGFLLAIFLILTSAYLEFYKDLVPCTLCMIQRYVLIILAFLFLCGALHTPLTFWRRTYSLFILLIDVVGIAAAWRHVWLQHLPSEQTPACLPGLNYILSNVPVIDAVKLIAHGGGDCAKVDWIFLRLSIAEWSLTCFVVFGLLLLVQILRRKA